VTAAGGEGEGEWEGELYLRSSGRLPSHARKLRRSVAHPAPLTPRVPTLGFPPPNAPVNRHFHQEYA